MNVRSERMNKITLFYVMDLIGEEIPFFTMDNEAVIFIDRRCKSHFIVCIVNKNECFQCDVLIQDGSVA